jgi:hypothetical protein
MRLVTVVLMACGEPESAPKGEPSPPGNQEPSETSEETSEPVACELDLAPPAPVQSACWQVSAAAQAPPGPYGPVTSAVVGRLDDDLVPEWVLEPSILARDLEVIEGTGAPFLSFDGAYQSASMILDSDGDGQSELLVTRQAGEDALSYEMAAYDAAGTVLWSSDPLVPELTDQGFLGWAVPTAGDVDGDGEIELVLGVFVLDGSTGALERTLQLPLPGWSTLLLDLDADGELEIAQGKYVLAQDGSLAWQAPVLDLEEGPPPVHPLPLQLDGDAELELGFFAAGTLYRHESDGTPIDALEVPAVGQARAPCVADFDGDGAPELGLPSDNTLAVMETDGTLLWQAQVSTSGCSAADLDLDGAAELVVAGYDGLWIFDGRTGEPRLRQTDLYGSAPPVIVDLDGDEDAEIVVSSYDYTGTVPSAYVVLDAPGWPGVGSRWSMADYAEERLSEEGAVGPGTGGALRSRSTWDLGLAPAVMAQLGDACSTTCASGQAQVALQLLSRGPLPVTLAVEIVGVDASGGERVVGTAQPSVQGWSVSSVAVTVEAPGDIVSFYARLPDGSMCASQPTLVENPCLN